MAIKCYFMTHLKYKIPNLKNTKKTGRGLRKKEGMQKYKIKRKLRIKGKKKSKKKLKNEKFMGKGSPQPWTQNRGGVGRHGESHRKTEGKIQE